MGPPSGPRGREAGAGPGRRAGPALSGARVLGHRVGLRPARPEVRLEAEDGEGGRVVHCYGHGGAGVTLSWGCADEVPARGLASAGPGAAPGPVVADRPTRPG